MQKSRIEKDVRGLLYVAKFGWLRTAELGKLLWPESKYSRQIADQFLSSWIKRKLVIVRELPERHGRIFVLSKGGVNLLAEHGIIATTSGKNIGRTEAGKWIPPSTWKHDLMAAGVLAELHKHGYDIYPEHEIRRRGNVEPGMKIPDGLAVKNDQVIWLEVENARKTGKYAKALAGALIRVSDGSIYKVLGKKANTALVAYPADLVDERGYSLDHKTRVKRIIASQAKQAINLLWAECWLAGAGVESISFRKEKIESDRAISVAKQLEAYYKEVEKDVYEAYYATYYIELWKEPVDGYGNGGDWRYYIKNREGEEFGGVGNKSISEVKKSVADFISKDWRHVKYF